MNKLFIICGFDRIGKDTLLDKLVDHNNLIVYKQNNNPPNYRNNKKFRKWLLKFLKKQANKLISINNNIVMARLFASDFVYSTLFRRPSSTWYSYKKLHNKFEIHQIILLYKNYEHYLKRCEICKCEVEYNEEEFNMIQRLYEICPWNMIFKTKIYYEPNIDFEEQIKYINEVINNG